MSNPGSSVRLLCVCGKKLRVPANASQRSSKGKCPKCSAPFQFLAGRWVCVESPLANQLSNATPADEGAASECAGNHSEASHSQIDGRVPCQVAEPEVAKSSDVSQLRSTPVTDESTNGKEEPSVPLENAIASSYGDGGRSNLSDVAVDETAEDGCATVPQPISNSDTDYQQNQLNGKSCSAAGEPSQTPRSSCAPDGPVDAADANDAPVAQFTSSAHTTTRESGYALTHEQVRQSIANALRLADRYDVKAAGAISLACHPWPDREICDQLRNAIAAELLPAHNINHPALDEIAADRLLRLAEVATFAGDALLEHEYFSGARVITEAIGNNAKIGNVNIEDLPRSGIVASPLGATVRQGDSTLFNRNTKPSAVESFDTEKCESLIHGLLSGAYKSGFRDIGLICGGEPVNVTVDELASHLKVVLPEQAFDAHLKSLSTRKCDVLKSRSYCLGQTHTLLDIAARWSVTRERVRQIEVKATEKVKRLFGTAFQAIGKQALHPFQMRIAKKYQLHDAALTIAEKSEYREMLAAFLLSLFGPWQTVGEWCIHETLSEKVTLLEQTLLLDADQYGFINPEQLASDCDGLFFTDEDRDAYLIEVMGLGQSFGNWTVKATMKCRAASAIKKIGKPATKEELADLLGVDRQRVGSILGNIEGVVRADRYRWGFVEWVDDVYDGIVGEIEQRIDAYNGAVPVHVLVSEIPAQFNVTEGSVRAYLASTAFVVENDMVRRAEGDDYSPRRPDTCKQAVRVGDEWAYRSVIYERHFNGYSLAVNCDVAYANGLRPGDDLIVPVEGCDYQVSLIWRAHNLNRLVDVGRVSQYLQTEGYEAGEVVLIVPSRTGVKLIREDQGDELSLGSAVADPQQGHHEQHQLPSDPLLDLLGDI